MTPLVSETLQRYRLLAERVDGLLFSGWQEAQFAKLGRFAKVIEREVDALEQSNATSSSNAVWQATETRMRETLAQIVEVTIPGSENGDENAWDRWQQEFQQDLTEIAEAEQIIISPSAFNPSTTDGLLERLWKWRGRNRAAIRRLAYSLRNSVRRWTGKPPLEQAPEFRVLALQDFASFYFQVPVAQFFHQKWLEFLRLTASQWSKVHQDYEQIKLSSQELDKLLQDRASLNSEQIASRMQRLRTHVELLQSLQHELADFQTGSKERLQQLWTEIAARTDHDSDYAGTFVLPSAKFSNPKAQQALESLGKQAGEDRVAWVDHFQAEREEWEQDLELSLLQFRTARICMETLEVFCEKAEGKLVPVLADIKRALQSSMARLGERPVSDKAAFQQVVKAEADTLLRTLRQQKLPAVQDGFVNADLQQTDDSFLRRLNKAVDELAERHLIFRYRDDENLVPRSKTDLVPAKQLVREDLLPKTIKQCRALADEIKDSIEQILRAVAEVDQVVEFSLEGAISLLQEPSDGEPSAEAHKVAQEGLERAAVQVEALIVIIGKVVARTVEVLPAASKDLIDRLQELLDSEKILALKLRVARAHAREKFRRNVYRLWELFKSALPQALSLLSGVFRRFQEQYLHIKRVTGLDAGAAEVEDEIVYFLTETRKQIDSLPFVYQRLFRIEPLMDERFFAGRQAALDLLKRDFAAWQNGHQAMVALVGERGSGRTTFLNFAEKQIYPDIPITKIDITLTTFQESGLVEYLAAAFEVQGVASLTELENRLVADEEQRMCVVENIQNLYLRIVDGFEAIERFLLFLTRTQKHILWIVSCTLYSWKYLDKALKISRFFRRVVMLGALQHQEIEAVIMKRHRVSGYQLTLEIPPEVANTRKFKKLTSEAAQQEFLRLMLFEKLNDFADGNITIAMLFWLRAIREISKQQVMLSPLIDFDHSFLQRLTDGEVFTLGALLHHETLTAEQHALIFHQSPDDSYLMVEQLRSKGIVVATPNGYLINQLLYRPLVRLLTAKNILH